MKILLCTNTFRHISHGPAKFANLILEINQLFPEHEIKILTEDVLESSDEVFKMEVEIPGIFVLFGQFIRMFLYHRNVSIIKKEEYDFDVVIYINSFFGWWNALHKRSYLSVGKINDDNNVDTNLQNFSFSRLWFKRFLFKQFERMSIKKHDLIISNSEYLSKKLIQEYKIPPGKIKRLYKSLDLENATFNANRKFDSPVKIVFVKSDFLRGGLVTLAQAIKLIKEKEFELVVIGPEEKFKSKIYQIFEGIQNCKLIFLGEQTQEIVFKYLSQADIFCVPSYKEALGVANIEALAFGIPVVTTRVGGIPEVLDGGNNGWLAEPNDSESLARELKKCIDSPELRKTKSAKGADFVKGNFDKNIMFRNLLTILSDLQKKSS